MSEDRAARRAEMPEGTERFLDRRSLRADHRHLDAVLRPGMRVLDVGCGTGAITRGIASAVAPDGEVLGIDLSAELIARAVAASDEPNLRYMVADVNELDGLGGFDLVNAARVLQWLSDPAAAINAMVAATKPGGRVVVLDYNHTRARWQPPLPPAAERFYAAFLAWRTDAGMDNDIAARLPQLFADAGLGEIEVADASERTRRGDLDFSTRIELWPAVIATRGHQMVADGFLTEPERAAAEQDLRDWAREHASMQELCLTAVIGTKPPGASGLRSTSAREDPFGEGARSAR